MPKSIRQNNKLYADFKPIAQELWGSVCRAIESFQAAVIIAHEQKVHYSVTGQPISIGKIVIERNLRPRRRLEVRNKLDSEITVVKGCDFCYGKEPVVAVFREKVTKIKRKVCSFHAKQLRSHPKWGEVNE